MATAVPSPTPGAAVAVAEVAAAVGVLPTAPPSPPPPPPPPQAASGMVTASAMAAAFKRARMRRGSSRIVNMCIPSKPGPRRGNISGSIELHFGLGPVILKVADVSSGKGCASPALCRKPPHAAQGALQTSQGPGRCRAIENHRPSTALRCSRRPCRVRSPLSHGSCERAALIQRPGPGRKARLVSGGRACVGLSRAQHPPRTRSHRRRRAGHAAAGHAGTRVSRFGAGCWRHGQPRAGFVGAGQCRFMTPVRAGWIGGDTRGAGVEGRWGQVSHFSSSQ